MGLAIKRWRGAFEEFLVMINTVLYQNINMSVQVLVRMMLYP